MYDVVIIGAGIVGASIFRELTKYDLSVLTVEKENDVCMGSSKANSAIVHAGYDPKPNTLMAKYNVEGNKMFDKLCSDLSVPFKRNGSLIVAFSDEELESLNKLYKRGIENKVEGLKILDKQETLNLEPNLKDDVKGALLAPTGGIVGVYELTIASVENALCNAVNACLQLGEEEKKRIELRVFRQHEQIVVLLANTYNKANTRSNTYALHPHHEHGYGIQNIKRVIRKYNGTYLVKKEDVYKLMISFPLDVGNVKI